MVLGVIHEIIQWQIPIESKCSREGDLRLLRESGEISHGEMGMEEEREADLRSVDKCRQGQGLWQECEMKKDGQQREKQAGGKSFGRNIRQTGKFNIFPRVDLKLLSW